MTVGASFRFVPPREGKGAILRTIETGTVRATVIDVPSMRRGKRPALFILGGELGFSSLEALGWLASYPPTGSLTDAADVIFIDPPGTGFGADLPKSLWTVEADAAFHATTIAAWCDKFGGTTGAVHLLGNGFGGLRALKTAQQLQRRFPGAAPRSLILMQTVTNPALLSCVPGNPIAYAMRLPTLALSARQGQQHELTQDYRLRAERAALDELYPALLRSERLEAEARDNLRASLAERFGAPAGALLDDGLLGRPIQKSAMVAAGFAKPWLTGRFDPLIADAYLPANSAIATGWDWWSGQARGDFDNLDLTPVLTEILNHPSAPRVLSLEALLDETVPYFAVQSPSSERVHREYLACANFAEPMSLAPGPGAAIRMWLLTSESLPSAARPERRSRSVRPATESYR